MGLGISNPAWYSISPVQGDGRVPTPELTRPFTGKSEGSAAIIPLSSPCRVGEDLM